MLLLHLLLSVSRSHQFSASLSFMCNLFVWLTSSSSRRHRRAAPLRVTEFILCHLLFYPHGPPVSTSSRVSVRSREDQKTEKGGLCFTEGPLLSSLCVRRGRGAKVWRRWPSLPPLHRRRSSWNPLVRSVSSPPCCFSLASATRTVPPFLPAHSL